MKRSCGTQPRPATARRCGGSPPMSLPRQRSVPARTRVKPIVGPFQIELPLQMPLFPHEPSQAPARPAEAPASPTVPAAEPTSSPAQPLLVTPGLAS